MGRVKTPLSERAVTKLARSAGAHAVGGHPPGLYLHVGGGAGRSWVLRFMLAGRRREMGLGSYRDLTLAQAREKAQEARKLIAQGIDPLEARRGQMQALIAARASRKTFAECVGAYLKAHGDSWKNPKHRSQWQNTLDVYAAPAIGGRDVDAIDTTAVLSVLEPIWKDKAETASRLRGRIEAVLDFATVHGFRTGDNPARWKGHLDKLLARQSKTARVKHHAALPHGRMAAFMDALQDQVGVGARALEFAVLTACRSGEVRGATWAEIDLVSRKWIIPQGRMKAGKEHHVPLSDPAVKLLERLPRMAGTDLLFPGLRGAPLSDMTLTAAIRRMNGNAPTWTDGAGEVITAHGFRSTFRDWAGETTSYPREVIEHALAHQLKDKAEAAYARGTLFDKRARLMSDWAAYCCNVLAIRGSAAP